jgi:hypothetical protein
LQPYLVPAQRLPCLRQPQIPAIPSLPATIASKAARWA